MAQVLIESPVSFVQRNATNVIFATCISSDHINNEDTIQIKSERKENKPSIKESKSSTNGFRRRSLSCGENDTRNFRRKFFKRTRQISCETQSLNSLIDIDCPIKSPSSRRAKAKQKVISLRDDIERMFVRVRSAGIQLKTRLTPTRSSRSPQCEILQAGQRYVVIEYADDFHHHESNNSKNFLNKDDDDIPDHNFSPSLVMEPLRDGMFEASMPLKCFPPNHNIIVRVNNCTLDILLQKNIECHADRHEKNTIIQAFHSGEVDLPIYVDSKTLNFEVDDNNLIIQARTKFSLPRKLSVSTSDIHSRLSKLDHKQEKKFLSLERSKNRNLAHLTRPRCYTR